MTFHEAMEIWLAGDQLDRSATLIGITIGWWARIVKTLQLASGFVVLIDIVGVRRVRAGGRTLMNLIPRQLLFSAPKYIRRRMQILSIDCQLWLARPEEPEYIREPPIAEGAYGRPIGKGRLVFNPRYSKADNDEICRQRSELEARRRAAVAAVRLSWVHYLPGWIGVACFAWGFGKLTTALYPVTIHWMIFLGLAPWVFFISTFLILSILSVLLRMPAWLLELLVLQPAGRLLSQPRVKNVMLTISLVILVLASLADILFS